MPPTFEALPNELLLQVSKYLRHHDLTQLMRVAHRFHALIEPVFWAKIELHRLSFHEDYIPEELREQEASLQRPYLLPADESDAARADKFIIDEMGRDQDERAMQFLEIFTNQSIVDRDRAEYLAKLVRWLCLPVNGEYTYLRDDQGKFDPWNALAMFINVEYLEISAFWKQPEEIVPFERPETTMAKLTTLKLRGHIPPEFVRHACSNSPIINELQLAVLDVPIGSILSKKQQNPPPEIDSDSEEEDLDQELVAPRPLACLSPAIISHFTFLTRLSLSRPCEALSKGDTFYEIYVSAKSDLRVLSEWAALIRTSKDTLVCLTLDQRPVAEETEPESTSNDEYMEYYCNGPGYKRFMDIVLPSLLEDADWPNLQSIMLFGFETNSLETNENSLDLVGKLKARFGSGVTIVNKLGRRVILESGPGLILSAGDILDSYNGFEEEREEAIDQTIWQCENAIKTGDWTFGRLPRLA